MNIKFNTPKIMQLNITKKCNMACYHCHVEAGPKRNEDISKEIVDKAYEVFKKFKFKALDITGGAPEMSQNLEYILNKFSPITDEISVRSNLTILLDENYSKFIDIYKKFDIKVIASVPFYEANFNDAMRGKGSFEKEIKALKLLNKAGIYNINLIYNPNGAYLPPKESDLELVYKEELAKYGVKFDKLLCMCNVPIGRFEKMLKRFDEYDDYIELLRENLNEENLENVMCRNLINIAYDGVVYDCDFNAALNLNIGTLDEILNLNNLNRDIKTNTHCLACVSGEGSGCFGAINKG
ncbi:radical SAM/Cys-rich domain protein [Campylobacter sp. FMV-PI01]|uniref:Radical SAM/Cys-rich domain protein n=1 Tax=Campylobacter portucalensis TaxID=2608384 RepID=A0A6L5WJ53_9BACT|nr:arsenosugar biosynthesis radical SAM (seleno)protein ArsS [Campylobacter portucalensis]MSN96045.1 radical SAM/Cys-rich domain protein [Campylobacter portucalensis]